MKQKTQSQSSRVYQRPAGTQRAAPACTALRLENLAPVRAERGHSGRGGRQLVARCRHKTSVRFVYQLDQGTPRAHLTSLRELQLLNRCGWGPALQWPWVLGD